MGAFIIDYMMERSVKCHTTANVESSSSVASSKIQKMEPETTSPAYLFTYSHPPRPNSHPSHLSTDCS